MSTPQYNPEPHEQPGPHQQSSAQPPGPQPSGYVPGGFGHGAVHGGWAQPPQGTQPGEAVGPAGAIRNFFGKYAQFTGRASRSEYWWVTLVLMLAGFAFIIVLMLASLLVTIPASSNGGDVGATGAAGTGFALLAALLYMVFTLAVLVPSLAVTVRRLHDADRSGWWYFITFVPLVGSFILLFFMIEPSNPRGARFDA